MRADYLNLPRDLLELTRGFNLELPPDRQRDAATLVLAIECVDRILDSFLVLRSARNSPRMCCPRWKAKHLARLRRNHTSASGGSVK